MSFLGLFKRNTFQVIVHLKYNLDFKFDHISETSGYRTCKSFKSKILKITNS